MKCLECQDWLQRRLDGEAAPDEKTFEQHLAGCPSCREQHAAALKLLHGLQHCTRPSPPPELSVRVTAAVLRDRALRQRRMTRRLYVTAALAASVFLMLIVSYALQPRHEAPEGSPPVVQQPERPAPEPRHAEAPEVKERRDERQAALPERLVDRTREQLNVLLPALAPDVAVERLAELEPLDPATQSLKQAGQEVTASLQTVTRSARQAFDYFSRELPVFDLAMRD